jgi:hypothetical protein
MSDETIRVREMFIDFYVRKFLDPWGTTGAPKTWGAVKEEDKIDMVTHFDLLSNTVSRYQQPPYDIVFGRHWRHTKNLNGAPLSSTKRCRTGSPIRDARAKITYGAHHKTTPTR